MTSSRHAISGILAALLGLGAVPVLAQDAGEVSKVSLVAERDRVVPGQTILLGLTFDLDDHWHIYWDGRNDTGFSPTVDWTLPEGVTVGPMLWPAPHRYESPGGILDHVYEGRPTILIPVTIGDGILPDTTLQIAGQVEWLVCNDVCLPGFGPVSIELVVGRMGNSSFSAPRLSSSETLGKAAARLPEPVLPGNPPKGLSLVWKDEQVAVRFEGATEVSFYPSLASTSLVSALEDGHAKGNALTLRLEPKERDLSKSEDRRLIGVLEVRREGHEPGWFLIDFGADGYRAPANAETISRVRDRVDRRSS